MFPCCLCHFPTGTGQNSFCSFHILQIRKPRHLLHKLFTPGHVAGKWLSRALNQAIWPCAVNHHAIYADKQVDAIGHHWSMGTSTDPGGHLTGTFELCSFSTHELRLWCTWCSSLCCMTCFLYILCSRHTMALWGNSPKFWWISVFLCSQLRLYQFKEVSDDYLHNVIFPTFYGSPTYLECIILTFAHTQCLISGFLLSKHRLECCVEFVSWTPIRSLPYRSSCLLLSCSAHSDDSVWMFLSLSLSWRLGLPERMKWFLHSTVFPQK